MGRHRIYRQRKYAVGQELLSLRTKAGLTQIELAAEVGVNRRSIQHWENGEAYPKEPGLQRVIAVFLAHHAFSPGREEVEAQALWDLISQDAPRRFALFDGAWFDRLLMAHRSAHGSTSVENRGQGPDADALDIVDIVPEAGMTRPSSSSTAQTGSAADDSPVPTPGAPAGAARSTAVVDWGEAVDVPILYGRDAELERLAQWATIDRCRVVAVLGLGGIGKTSLAIAFAQRAANHFDAVVFRSLRDAPPLGPLLDGVTRAVTVEQSVAPERVADKVARLIHCLRERRCLLVLDNLEALLREGDEAGEWRTGYGEYGALIQRLGEAAHRSCVLLTSREKPVELAPLESASGPVRTRTLKSLDAEACRVILESRDIGGAPEEIAQLARLYGGNPLALKLVSMPIRDLFAGDAGAFLAGGEAFFNGVGKLLAEQIDRASPLERSLLEWLAIAREPISLGALVDMSLEPATRGDILHALEALRRRSLIERAGRGATFTLQPVIMEYVTSRLIAEVGRALRDDGDAASATQARRRLARHALILATTRDYVRRAQERLIATPLLEQVAAYVGGRGTVERVLLDLLDGWHGRPEREQGYGPGNVVNLLRLLRGHLRGLDLCDLSIRQAYVQEVEMQDARLARSHLSESVLAQAFDYSVCAALSADGAYLAAGTNSGEVRVWRMADRAPLLTARAHVGGTYSIAMSADGRRVVTGGADGLVRAWDVESGTCRATLSGHTDLIHDVALSADGQLIASASFDETVRLWAPERGPNEACLAILRGHRGVVWGVALSADGSLVASGGVDGTVRLWATDSGICQRILEGHAGGVWDVALSADGRLVASGSVDGTVRLWHTGDGSCRTIVSAQQGLILGVALSADGRLLASGGIDGTVRLWTTESATCLAILQGHSGLIRGVALSADGQLVASVSFDGTIRLWETETARPLETLRGQTSVIWTVALTPDAQLLASGGLDGTIRVWDAGEGLLVRALQAHSGMILGLAFSSDGSLLASGGFDGVVKVWQTATGDCLASLRGHSGPVWAVAVNADGNLLASGGSDGTVRLWETATGQEVMVLHAHDGPVWGATLSLDGRLLASGGFDGAVKVWDTASGTTLASLHDQGAPIWAVALSADGRLVASGAEHGALCLWETETARLHATLRGHHGAVFRIAISANGQFIASAGMDGTARVWRAQDGTKVHSLPVHSGAVWAVALSANGQVMASGDREGKVVLWDVSTGTLLRTLRADRLYERLDITGVTGLSEARKATLLDLGAIEHGTGERTRV